MNVKVLGLFSLAFVLSSAVVAELFGGRFRLHLDHRRVGPAQSHFAQGTIESIDFYLGTFFHRRKGTIGRACDNPVCAKRLHHGGRPADVLFVGSPVTDFETLRVDGYQVVPFMVLHDLVPPGHQALEFGPFAVQGDPYFQCTKCN